MAGWSAAVPRAKLISRALRNVALDQAHSCCVSLDRVNVANESSTNDVELRRLFDQSYAMSDSVIAALLLFVTTNGAEWATDTHGRGSTLINELPLPSDGWLPGLWA